jgi:pimeloyl-ACP methyl ester carboxylesterase
MVPAPIILVLHGLDGSDELGDGIDRFRHGGLNVFAFNYCGTGETKGNFSLRGMVDDTLRALEVIENLKSPLFDGRIGLFCHSLGSGVGIHAVSEYHRACMERGRESKLFALSLAAPAVVPSELLCISREVFESRYLIRLNGASYERYMKEARTGFSSTPLEDVLSDIRCPTQVITALKDKLWFIPAQAARVEREIPGELLESVRVRGVDHSFRRNEGDVLGRHQFMESAYYFFQRQSSKP